MNDLPVREVMTRDFVGVSESDDLLEAVRTIRNADATGALVLRGGEPVGYLSAGAVLDHLVDAGGFDTTVAEVMADVPPSIRPETSVAAASNQLAETNADHVVVANGEGVLGLLDARDVARTAPEPIAAPAGDGNPPPAEPDDRVGEHDDTYSQRSVCEVCGALAESLSNVNGQLVCADCRTV
mgnify:FL=1